MVFKSFGLKKTNFGFTLIELLVVIAIIGVLATIVIGSLTNTRQKAADEAVRQTLDQMRIAAVIYRDDYGNYGDPTDNLDCNNGIFATNEFTKIIENAKDIAGNKNDVNDNPVLCISTSSNGGAKANTWSVSVRLKSDVLSAWCVDNTGQIKIGHASLDGLTNTSICGQ